MGDSGLSISGMWAMPELERALTCEPMRVVPPAAWAGHIPFAFWLVGSLRPGTFVELGTHSGNSFFAFCQAMAKLTPIGRAYAVDTWAGDEHAGPYGEDVFAEVSTFNELHFSSFSTLLRTTFDDARSYFASDAIDLLHIDGLHTYAAVRHDFETWQGTLSRRAVVLFHDINVRERGFGVWRFWDEIRERYPSFSFHHSHGLGVLGVGSEQHPALQALFSLGEGSGAGTFRGCLAARGEAFKRLVEISELRAAKDRAAGFDAELLRRDDAMAWRDTLLQAQRDLVASKDAALASLENTAAARAQALLTRDRLLDASDIRTSQLIEDLRQQRFMTREERRVRDEMQAGYEEAIASINRHREELRLEADRARLEIPQRYVGSISWKVTRPLRAAARLLQQGGPNPADVPAPPIRAPAAPPVPEAADSEKKPDVSNQVPLKQAFRTLLAARLQAFLSGSELLRLPHAEQPRVSIVLVLFNQAELTFACLESIVETLSAAPFGVELVIADNGSDDDTPALLDRLDGATILRHGSNLHFLKAVNLAVQSARGQTLLLLNNDAQLLPGSVASALRTLDSDPAIGAVGGRIILPDGTLQEAGSIIWRDGACSGFARGRMPTAPEVMFQRDVDYCSGAFLLTPIELFRGMGGFDERFAPAYYEETDYCVRLWVDGRRVVYDPDAAIIHYEFGSSAASVDALALQAANHSVFVAKHRDWLSRQFPASPLNVLAASRARLQEAKARVLVLEDRVPRMELGSGYPRTNRLVHELVEAGADVTFFPMTRFKQDWREVRRALDKRVEVMIDAEAEELGSYLVARAGMFDMVLVCRPHNMAMFLEAIGPERHILAGAAVLYDAEALFVTRDIQRREAEGNPVSALERHEMMAREVALTRIADAVFSVSPSEQHTLEEYGAREVHLLGHALDEEPLPTTYEERDQIVFLGTIGADDLPNADAVRWFASEILPHLRETLERDDLRLTVVGLNKAATVQALNGESVDLVGMVEELPPALARARIMVVPSRLGAGIPMKAHQTAMFGIPMVTTSLIASQLGWSDGVELLVADDPVVFAEACARLYRDQQLWTRIRANALERARRDCSPAAFASMVRSVLVSVPLVHRQPEPDLATPPSASPPHRTASPKIEPQTSRIEEEDWSVAVPFSYVPGPSQPKIGVICHVFHTDVAVEMRHYLRNLPAGADLFLSTDTEEKEAQLRAAFSGWDGGSLEVRVTPNRGRDIAPKLVGFADVHDRCDLVLHLHSKVSTHLAALTPWRSYLLEVLLGSPEVVRSILDAFERLPDLGMVAPQHFEAVRRWLGWNGNYTAAASLAKRLGITLSPNRALDFPSGSMFWARPAALRPILNLGLSFDDFPTENGQLDHTLAHAVERMFFHACERSGHSWLKVSQPALMFDTRTVAEVTSPLALSQFVADHGVALGGAHPPRTRSEPSPMLTQVAPGLNRRLASRSI